MRKFYGIFLVGTSVFTLAQQGDSATLISEVRIEAYKKPTSYLASTKSVALVTEKILQNNTPERLLESINHQTGSRMEERSPGSYRVSIRGSALRSPFGVRNVKIYLDDFILSDASGNTYLNSISPELINSIEIYKGPESGDFGAVTGGTMLLKTLQSERFSANLSVGSYGTFNESVQIATQKGKHFFQIFQNFYQSDAYREQSAVRRSQFFLKDNFQYSERSSLKGMVLLSNLDYQTPGGLTVEQMLKDRKQARLSTKTLRGATEQNAGIRNKMVVGGISHETKFHPQFSHFLMVQGSYVDFENPFITNFENRYESNFALRTHLNFEKNWTRTALEWRLGYEGASNNITIRNFDNNKGIAGKPQNFDELQNNAGFFFLSQKLNHNGRWFSDLSLSLNSNSYNWEKKYPLEENGSVKFADQFLPNFGLTYLISDGFSVRAKVGKGNSSPTNEEIRSSSQEFNFNLKSEFGWNKEIGFRSQIGKILFIEGTYFDFRLQDAIVKRQTESGEDYFVNQGETAQRGVEVLLETRKLRLQNSFLNQVQLRFAGNFYDFKYRDYQLGKNNFSGNDLPGVPKTSVSSLVNMSFFKRLGVDYSHFYTTKIPLNDANTVWSEPSLTGNVQLTYATQIERSKITLKLQVQNLYNTNYVLGYDINAFGGRFYNPAAKRTFHLGVNAQF